MNRYRKISVMMYGDRKFRELSKPEPNAQSLWIYLLTGPHCTSFPAAFSSGEAGLAEALEWPIKAFRKVFDELLSKGMVQVDWPARYIFIPNALKHNPPENPNVVKAWRKAFNELPDCALKVVTFDAAMQFLAESFEKQTFIEGFGEDLGKEFREEFGKTEQNNNRTEAFPKPPSGDLPQSDPKITFGEFAHVRLTSQEHSKLGERLGGQLEHYINRLDRWGEEEPRKFAKKKSHYATILNWHDRDLKDGKTPPPAGNNRPRGVVL